MSGGNECKLRRHAFQIVQQLPENGSEAMRVLDYARELVRWEETKSAASDESRPPSLET